MLQFIAGGALVLAGTTFQIDLGDDLVTGIVEHVGQPALSDQVWRGSIEDVPGGWFLLVSNGDAVVGEVSIPGAGHFHIRDTGDGHRRVVCVDPPGRLACHADERHLVQGPGSVPVSPATSVSGMPDVCGDSIIVDVMFVYTEQAESINGGQAAIEATIDSYIEYANMVYEASGVGHRFRLVHAQQIFYNDSGNILTDLSRITDPNDGHMDDVHPLRDAWGADLVSVITNTPSAGVGWGMQELSVSFESMGFSVLGAAPDPIPGGLVFAHETGHNMGCQHNNSTQAPEALFCYSYGHRTSAPEQWRTIMSNPPGTFVDFFSSPDLQFDGFPLGVSGDGCPSDAADSVRTMNESAATVAMFRPTVVPLVCPGDVTGDGIVNIEDLLLVILGWGPCPTRPPCGGDANGDGTVDVQDLVLVVLNWTA